MCINLTESRSARGTEQADGMLGGQLFGPGGNTTLEYWIDGRRIRAAWKAPQRKRPCRSRATARRSLLRLRALCVAKASGTLCGAVAKRIIAPRRKSSLALQPSQNPFGIAANAENLLK